MIFELSTELLQLLPQSKLKNVMIDDMHKLRHWTNIVNQLKGPLTVSEVFRQIQHSEDNPHSPMP